MAHPDVYVGVLISIGYLMGDINVRNVERFFQIPQILFSKIQNYLNGNGYMLSICYQRNEVYLVVS